MLYGTIYILILAIVVAELPLGTQVLKASLMQVSKELEESASMAGASWVYTLRRVVLPLLLPAILAVGLIIFIAAVRDIPTVIFLASPQSRTLSLLMLDYITGAQYGARRGARRVHYAPDHGSRRRGPAPARALAARRLAQNQEICRVRATRTPPGGQRGLAITRARRRG